MDVHICYEIFHTSLSIFANAYTIGLGNIHVEAVGHRCDQVLSLCDQLCRYSVWTSVEELLDLCHFCSVYHHMLHPSGGAMFVRLPVLHTLRVVCEPGDSDSEHYVEQLLIEMEC